jgi:hypothetical protein
MAELHGIMLTANSVVYTLQFVSGMSAAVGTYQLHYPFQSSGIGQQSKYPTCL